MTASYHREKDKENVRKHCYYVNREQKEAYWPWSCLVRRGILESAKRARRHKEMVQRESVEGRGSAAKEMREVQVELSTELDPVTRSSSSVIYKVLRHERHYLVITHL